MLGGLLSGILGYFSQEETNDANVMLNRENRYHQEHLANTQYQRAVADMKAAGLNPALMFKNAAPSAVPSTNPATVQSEFGSAVTSAQQIGSVLASIEKIGAEVGLIDAQKKNVEAQTITEIAKPDSVKAMTALYGANTAKAVAETVTEGFRAKTEAEKPGELISRSYGNYASAGAAHDRGYRDRAEATQLERFGSGYLGREVGSGHNIGRYLQQELQRLFQR